MKIHFICFGNVYRSRLAETYLNSKKIAGVEVISSGIGAAENKNRPISWLTQRLFEMYKLVPFQKPNWTQTSNELLKQGDLTIFFSKEYYDYCVANFGFNSSKYEIWEIPDLQGFEELTEKLRITENAFKVIQEKVDSLVKEL